MKPEGTRVWRKAKRAALKGVARGRRPRRVMVEAPRRGSTGRRLVPADQTAAAADTATAETTPNP